MLLPLYVSYGAGLMLLHVGVELEARATCCSAAVAAGQDGSRSERALKLVNL